MAVYPAEGSAPGRRVADGVALADAPGRSTTLEDARSRGTQFHGSVPLNPMRVGRDAGAIAEAVIQHLANLPNAEVHITLEIRVEIPDPVPEHVVRTVTENCRTLRFESQGFEAV